MKTWNGYIDLGADGVGTISIEDWRPDDSYAFLISINGEEEETAEDRKDLFDEFNGRLYASMADYRAGKPLNMDEVWPA